MAEKWIDEFFKYMSHFDYAELSHELEPGMPTYPTHPKYDFNLWPAEGDPAEIHSISISDHLGTHVDSPSHFVREEGNPLRIDIAGIMASAFTARMIKIKINPIGNNYAVSKEEIVAFEARSNIEITSEDIVVFDFGWSQRWHAGEEGASFLKNWPGLGLEASEYLVSKHVKGVGTECIGLDTGNGGDGKLPAHFTLLPNNILIYENLTNLDSAPIESIFVALPLRFKGGSGSPIRPIAIFPK
ncbi:MAG TPA: cyclase family protein [Bacillota bacterium]|nr:cyclase family protein [Bacillota bacterium]